MHTMCIYPSQAFLDPGISWDRATEVENAPVFLTLETKHILEGHKIGKNINKKLLFFKISKPKFVSTASVGFSPRSPGNAATTPILETS